MCIRDRLYTIATIIVCFLNIYPLNQPKIHYEYPVEKVENYIYSINYNKTFRYISENPCTLSTECNQRRQLNGYHSTGGGGHHSSGGEGHHSHSHTAGRMAAYSTAIIMLELDFPLKYSPFHLEYADRLPNCDGSVIFNCTGNNTDILVIETASVIDPPQLEM